MAFDESKHPRDDDGKFTDKASGEKRSPRTRQEYLEVYGPMGEWKWRLDRIKKQNEKDAWEQKKANDKAIAQRAKLEEQRLDNLYASGKLSASAKKTTATTENKNRKLSYEVGTVIDENGNVVLEAEGTANEVHIDISKLPKNSVLTHNHPHGTCFSPDDIDGFLKSDNIKQIRATSPDGKTFVLTKEGEADKSILDEYRKVGRLGDKYASFVQKTYDYYTSQGYDGWTARMKAESSAKENWLHENAEKYGIKFDIEWED